MALIPKTFLRIAQLLCFCSRSLYGTFRSGEERRRRRQMADFPSKVHCRSYLNVPLLLSPFVPAPLTFGVGGMNGTKCLVLPLSYEEERRPEERACFCCCRLQLSKNVSAAAFERFLTTSKSRLGFINFALLSPESCNPSFSLFGRSQASRSKFLNG